MPMVQLHPSLFAERFALLLQAAFGAASAISTTLPPNWRLTGEGIETFCVAAMQQRAAFVGIELARPATLKAHVDESNKWPALNNL